MYNLLDFNNLTNHFIKYGRNATFNWHFKKLVGNNFNNIFLSKEKILKLNKIIESKICKKVNAYLKNHPRTIEQINLMK